MNWKTMGRWYSQKISGGYFSPSFALARKNTMWSFECLLLSRSYFCCPVFSTAPSEAHLNDQYKNGSLKYSKKTGATIQKLLILPICCCKVLSRIDTVCPIFQKSKKVIGSIRLRIRRTIDIDYNVIYIAKWITKTGCMWECYHCLTEFVTYI